MSYPLCPKSCDAVFLPKKRMRLNKPTCLYVHVGLHIRLKKWNYLWICNNFSHLIFYFSAHTEHWIYIIWCWIWHFISLYYAKVLASSRTRGAKPPAITTYRQTLYFYLCFIITRRQVRGDYSCKGICGFYCGEMTGVQNLFWLLQDLLIPHTPPQVDYTASRQFYAFNFPRLPCNKTLLDTDPFTTRTEDKRSLYKIMKHLCRDSILKRNSVLCWIINKMQSIISKLIASGRPYVDIL